ncbi:MAG: YeiH family protein [Chloroflexota bacterium]|jgi:uncharacterized integral membrane protein (TIGR00698 family)
MAAIPKARVFQRITLEPMPGHFPGLALVVAIAVLASWLGRQFAALEPIVWAIVIGVAVRNLLGQLPATATGVKFASKQLLEFSVLLLGAAVNFSEILVAGHRILLLAALVVGLGISASVAIGRALGLSGKLSILIAAGNSICGNSAIAAVAPTIKAEKRDITMAIALTAVVGVVVVLTLPMLVPLLGLTLYQYGALAGATVYAVPQVVAASFPVSDLSGEVATLVKMVRVLLLGPVLIVFGLLFARKAGKGSGIRKATFLPWFVLGFLGLGVLRSLGVIPDGLAGEVKEISKLLMLVSMAALGLEVEIAAVRTVGPKVFATVVLSTISLTALSLGLIFFLGI